MAVDNWRRLHEPYLFIIYLFTYCTTFEPEGSRHWLLKKKVNITTSNLIPCTPKKQMLSNTPTLTYSLNCCLLLFLLPLLLLSLLLLSVSVVAGKPILQQPDADHCCPPQQRLRTVPEGNQQRRTPAPLHCYERNLHNRVRS